jgi:hypothetical protein
VVSNGKIYSRCVGNSRNMKSMGDCYTFTSFAIFRGRIFCIYVGGIKSFKMQLHTIRSWA